MSPENKQAIGALSKRRWQVAGLLTAAMVAAYFGFILLVAFDKELLATRVAPGLSLGIVLGAAVIGVAWILTGLYVRWANRHYDVQMRALQGETK